MSRDRMLPWRNHYLIETLRIFYRYDVIRV